MAKIYVSSTFVDLKEHRAAVIETLTQLGHQVVSMEHYVAEDMIPLAKCLADVRSCDFYLGIFAWRYGFIPPNSPNGLSITELEYREAENKAIPRLIFLLDQSIAWTPASMDVYTGEGRKGEQIQAFRSELQLKRLISFFTSPDNLARKVSVAVSLAISKARQQSLSGAEALADVQRTPLGSSLVGAIAESLKALLNDTKTIKVLEIDLKDGQYWWSSRLFLVAALLAEYTAVECLAFLSEGDQFFGLASPQSVVNALSKVYPEISRAYYQTIRRPLPDQDVVNEVFYRLQEFSIALGHLPGEEAGNKGIVTLRLLRQWLGHDLLQVSVALSSETLEPPQANQILNQPFNYVALTYEGKLQSVIDRTAFATQMARRSLEALNF
jgi:hypothetical protein